jgi:hypothetical protein
MAACGTADHCRTRSKTRAPEEPEAQHTSPQCLWDYGFTNQCSSHREAALDRWIIDSWHCSYQ